VAFWTGLIYDSGARAYALDTLGALSSAARQELWIAAGREGLRASAGGHSTREAARGLLKASKHALQARGFGEEKWLAPLEKNLHDLQSPADRVLEIYDGDRKRDLATLIRYSAERSA
jgi:glutamate--cysteine ligase